MDIVDNLLTIGVPAMVGLLGWSLLRQRNSPPLVAGCAALVIALLTMTLIFALLYVL